MVAHISDSYPFKCFSIKKLITHETVHHLGVMGNLERKYNYIRLSCTSIQMNTC